MISKLSASPSRLALIVGALAVLALSLAQLDTSADEPAVATESLPLAAPLVKGELNGSSRPSRRERGRKVPRECPDRGQIAEARRWAGDRTGSVAFAILDECKRLLGDHRFRTYYSASVVKAMLLAAYLRQDDVAGRGLSGSEEAVLGSMIERSDNKAADTVFASVGEAGLVELASDAEMRDFVPSPFWGGSGITAGDQATFMTRIERYVPRRHERFALGLLAGVIVDHRWGIAEVVPSGWRIHFKGGWYLADDGWRVSQVATLRRHDRAFGMAVLSDGNPSFQYGRETVAGVAKRLFRERRDRVKRPRARPVARRASAASAR